MGYFPVIMTQPRTLIRPLIVITDLLKKSTFFVWHAFVHQAQLQFHFKPPNLAPSSVHSASHQPSAMI
jgi:hypothetical protein